LKLIHACLGVFVDLMTFICVFDVSGVILKVIRIMRKATTEKKEISSVN